MKPVDFVRKLRARGVVFVLGRDGHPVYSGPVEVLTPELRAVMEQHAAAIARVLQAEAADEPAVAASNSARDLSGEPDPSRPCYCCGFGFFWRRAGGPWVCSSCHPPAVPGIVAERWTGQSRVPGPRPVA